MDEGNAGHSAETEKVIRTMDRGYPALGPFRTVVRQLGNVSRLRESVAGLWSSLAFPSFPGGSRPFLTNCRPLSTGLLPFRSVPAANQPFPKTDGHSEWAEMAVHHVGFTTAWTPNKVTPGGPGMAYPDVDLTSRRERLEGAHSPPSRPAATTRAESSHFSEMAPFDSCPAT